MRTQMKQRHTSPLFGLFGLLFVFSPLFGPSEAFVFRQYDEIPEVMDASRVVLLICFVVSCVFFNRLGKAVFQDKLNAATICTVFCSVGMILTSLPALGAPAELLIAGAALRGLGFGPLMYFWAANYTMLRGNDIGIALSATLLVFGLASTIVSIVARFSPLVAAALLTLYPLASCLGCVFVYRKTKQPSKSITNPEPLTTFGRVLFILCNFCFGCLFGVLLNCMHAIENEFITHGFILTAMCLLIIFLLYGRASDYARGFRIYAVVASLTLLTCSLISTSHPQIILHVVSLLWAIQIFYFCLLFIDNNFTVAGISHSAGGVALIALGLGVLTMAILPFGKPTALNVAEIVAASLACIIFSAAVFLPSLRRETSHFGFSSYTLQESDESFLIRRCEEITDQFDLTSRESEITLLLAQGHQVGTISKQLFISPLTVKTHLRNIYAKIDIHSQGEFMNLLYEGERIPPPPELQTVTSST